MIGGSWLAAASVWGWSSKLLHPQHSFQTPKLTQVTTIPTIKEPFNSENLSAEFVYVWHPSTGSVLYQKNPTQLLYPASTIKLLTALTALNQYSLQDQITIPPNLQVEGHRLGLTPGSIVTVEELLKASLVNSANDAAELLAQFDLEGRAHFIQEMNSVADELGLSQTSVVNPTGLDDPSQQSTIKDLSILAAATLEQPLFADWVSSISQPFFFTQPTLTTVIYNTNQLLSNQTYQVLGVKTGTTQQAGQVLLTAVQLHNEMIIISVAKSDDRYQDTVLILDWLSQNLIFLDPNSLDLDD